MPIIENVFKRVSWDTLSKALLKSIKSPTTRYHLIDLITDVIKLLAVATKCHVLKRHDFTIIY